MSKITDIASFRWIGNRGYLHSRDGLAALEQLSETHRPHGTEEAQ